MRKRIRRSPVQWMRAFLRNVFQRGERERELADELETYESLLAEEELLRGRGARDARRLARMHLGGMDQVKEEVRSLRAGASFETLVRDIRVGVRGLMREPVFTLTALVALGLGIGATATVFSVVNGVLLSPLRYVDPDELVAVLHDVRDPVAPANYLDWRQAGADFVELNAAEYWSPNLSGEDGAEKVEGLRVTPELFPMLGVAPQQGRHFQSDAGEPGNEREAILSEGLWLRRFGGDPGVIGTTIRLNGDSYTIVGVMPAEFQFAPFWATESELWVPLSLAGRADSRRGNSLRVFGRLADGVSLQAARDRMATITAALDESFPGTNRNVTVTPLEEMAVGTARVPLLVLFGAVSFLLLIACANVAHMMLARASSRQREIVLRAALGASRGRLVRQLLTESVMIAVAGGAVGIVLAVACIRLLRDMAGASLPRMDMIAMDYRVTAFALTISVVTGLLFGVVPALQSAGKPAADALRESDRGTTHGRGRSRARDGLMISEFALALILLAGAGLLARSLIALQRIDPGFDPDRVLSMQLRVNGAAAASPGARQAFYETVIERVRGMPGVAAASAINHLPLAGDLWGLPFAIEGRPPTEPGEGHVGTYRVVMPGYFETMGVALLRGRVIDERDAGGTVPVVVINEAMARRHWPDENPIGQRIAVGGGGADVEWRSIAGVVENVARGDWAAPPEEEFYLPLAQTPSMLEDAGAHIAYITLVVRTTGDAVEVAPSIRALVRDIDANVAVSDVQTMRFVVSTALAPSRLPVLMLGAFAVVALILAMVGIFGMTSYALSKRTQEIGIRLALGAEPGRVLGVLVRRGLVLAAVGMGAGLSGALILTRLMGSMLFGVTASDPVTYLSVSLTLGLVAVAGSTIPALRALRSDPVTSLRSD